MMTANRGGVTWGCDLRGGPPVLLEYPLPAPAIVLLQLWRGTPRSEPAHVHDSILIAPRVGLAAEQTGDTP